MVLGTPITCLADAGGAKRDAGSNHAFLGPKPWQRVCVISFSASICWKIECLVVIILAGSTCACIEGQPRTITHW